MTEYTLKDLQKDLKRLDKRFEDLTEWMQKESKEIDKIDYLAKDELTEKLIMPVYIAKRIELYTKYLETKQKVKVELCHS